MHGSFRVSSPHRHFPPSSVIDAGIAFPCRAGSRPAVSAVREVNRALDVRQSRPACSGSDIVDYEEIVRVVPQPFPGRLQSNYDRLGSIGFEPPGRRRVSGHSWWATFVLILPLVPCSLAWRRVSPSRW